MLPCLNGCAYKNDIPGNCHIQCRFAWSKADEKIKKKYPKCSSKHGQQWFHFPLNYDPTWGPNKCPAFSKKRDPKMTQKFDSFAELMSLLIG